MRRKTATGNTKPYRIHRPAQQMVPQYILRWADPHCSVELQLNYTQICSQLTHTWYQESDEIQEHARPCVATQHVTDANRQCKYRNADTEIRTYINTGIQTNGNAEITSDSTGPRIRVTITIRCMPRVGSLIYTYASIVEIAQIKRTKS